MISICGVSSYSFSPSLKAVSERQPKSQCNFRCTRKHFFSPASVPLNYLTSRADSKSGLLSRNWRSGGIVQARLFGPSTFDAKKLNVNFLDVGEEEHPANEDRGPRTYTLTHSDVTAELTLAISKTFNRAQYCGWYSRFLRDEVLAIWRRTREMKMALHVHCYISGSHALLNWIAFVRFWIFRRELPVVLEAFRHGDKALFDKHPELEHSTVWVHFHSDDEKYNRKECWGPLVHSAKIGAASARNALEGIIHDFEIAIEELNENWPGDKH